MKKQFVTPRVIQQVPVQLEKDLLQGSLQNAMKITSMGIGEENYDFSEGTSDNPNPYTIEWD